MQNRELHYRYGVSYLFFIIILLLSLAYYDVPNLVDKFSFALTLSSLLLAILAIFYTVISANKQDLQFNKIIEATSKLSNSASDIEHAAKGISNLTKEIPQHFTNLGTKIDELSIGYASLSEKQNHDFIGYEAEDFKLLKIISSLQFVGMATLYFFVKMYRTNNNIDLDDLSVLSEFGGVNGHYVVGLLNGFESTQLIGFKIYNNNIIPQKCDEILQGKLRALLGRVVNVIEKGNANQLSKTLDEIDSKYS